MFQENFIDQIMKQDLLNHPNMEIITRFPPEPNGYLHLGHIKSIALNFTLAQKYHGHCNLRFDDTNPDTAFPEFYLQIEEQIAWLGFNTRGRIFYTSDYFEELYAHALVLVQKGLAYVCFLSQEEIRATRGTLHTPGSESRYRNTSSTENMHLFQQMRAGVYAEGACTLRAKINMRAGNINLRDPVLYRVKKTHPHCRTGRQWCIYPSYDYAHTLADVKEKVTHSLCTLEFQDHQELYRWFLDVFAFTHRPQQIEFARLNVADCITSKRQIKMLLATRPGDTWSSPYLATIAGLKSRGYTPQALLAFCYALGISKQDAVIPRCNLEKAIRTALDPEVPRCFLIREPLKMTLRHAPETTLMLPNHPKIPTLGTRPVKFSTSLLIEKTDFVQTLAPGQKKITLNSYFRLIGVPGLCYCYAQQENEILCDYYAIAPAQAVPQATIHWLDRQAPAVLTLHDYEQSVPRAYIAFGEPQLAEAPLYSRYQCYRFGYIYKCAPTAFNIITTLT